MSSKNYLERKEELKSEGYRVISYTLNSVTLRRRHGGDRTLNIIASIITSGLWLFVWGIRLLLSEETIVLRDLPDGKFEESMRSRKGSAATENFKEELKKKNSTPLLAAIVAGIFAVVITSGVVTAIQNSVREAAEIERLENEIKNNWLHPLNVGTFDSPEVPWLIGKNVELVMQAFSEVEDFELWEVRNLDTMEEETRPLYSYDPNEEVYSGLYVCNQSLPPGSNFQGWKTNHSFSIEVSASCEGRMPAFVMGAAAQRAGKWTPTPISGASDIGDLSTVDGVFLEFVDEDTYGYPKRMIVRTGFGDVEAELAWIDLASGWCSRDATTEELAAKAIQARDVLFPQYQNIRLVQPEGLGQDKWFVHRLNSAGEPIDGMLPSGSANELLVATGYWVPDVYDIEYRQKNRYQNVSNHKWKVQKDRLENELLTSYAELLAKSANRAKSNPNPELEVCLTALQEEVDEAQQELAASRSERNNNRDRTTAVIVGGGKKDKNKNKQSDEEYDYLLDDAYWEKRFRDLGDSYDSGGSSGSNCTWVGGYTRKDGTRVRGHPRCR